MRDVRRSPRECHPNAVSTDFGAHLALSEFIFLWRKFNAIIVLIDDTGLVENGDSGLQES